ncbi:hypothetical protein HG531_007498 [Fusarium graminearum]|nr:hypothetical protein HG531_007498 [Fusarium graminearum]
MSSKETSKSKDKEKSKVHKLSLKGSARLVAEFFQYSIHSILFQRGVYPAEDFTVVKKYGLNMLVSADDQVKAYIKKIMSQLDKWMVGGKISKLVIVITDKDTGEHVERWQFDVQIFQPVKKSKSSKSAPKDQENPAAGSAAPTAPEKTEPEIQAEIAAIFRQITASVTFLPQLNGDCTFNVLVYADADSEVPVEWGDSDAKEIENGEKVQLRGFSTANHRVDTLVAASLLQRLLGLWSTKAHGSERFDLFRIGSISRSGLSTQIKRCINIRVLHMSKQPFHGGVGVRVASGVESARAAVVRESHGFQLRHGSSIRLKRGCLGLRLIGQLFLSGLQSLGKIGIQIERLVWYKDRDVHLDWNPIDNSHLSRVNNHCEVIKALCKRHRLVSIWAIRTFLARKLFQGNIDENVVLLVAAVLNLVATKALKSLFEHEAEGFRRVFSIGMRRPGDKLEQMLEKLERILLSHRRKFFVASSDKVLEHRGCQALLVLFNLHLGQALLSLLALGKHDAPVVQMLAQLVVDSLIIAFVAIDICGTLGGIGLEDAVNHGSKLRIRPVEFGVTIETLDGQCCVVPILFCFGGNGQLGHLGRRFISFDDFSSAADVEGERMLGQRIMKSIMVPLAGTTSVEALQTNIETIRIILSRCELINLLKGQTLGLVDEEVNESNTQETAAEPDEEDFGLEVGLSRAVIDEVGSRISCNVPVEKPVSGSGHTERLGTGLEREDLASNDPSQRTPGRGEEEDVDTDERDSSLLASQTLDKDGSISILTSGKCTSHGHDELRDTHADSTPEEKRSRLEAVEVRGLSNARLVLVVGPDLGELSLDSGMIGSETTDSGEGLGCGFMTILLDEESRSLGEDNHSTEKDERVCELNGDGDTVALGVSVAGAEEALPVWHGQNTRDGTGIITRTPPKATKAPMAIAGHVLPASSGLLSDALRRVFILEVWAPSQGFQRNVL